MNHKYYILLLISFLLTACKLANRDEEFSMVLKSNRSKFKLVIKEKDIVSVDWERQSYLLSDEIKQIIKDSIKTIAFSSSFIDFNINSEKIYTVGIGCLCSSETEHLGSDFAYMYLGCEDYFEPFFVETNGYYEIAYNNHSGMKFYLFNDRIHQLLLDKGKINAKNWMIEK